MDRAIIEQHLRLAKKHVALGERHIARQREIIAEFEERGYDASQARQLLALFEQSQELHIADRNRLLRELNASH